MVSYQNPQYEMHENVLPQPLYPEPRPNYIQNPSYVHQPIAREPVWNPNEVSYNPVYTKPPPGILKPIPQTNYYPRHEINNMYSEMPYYPNPREYYPRTNIAPAPGKRSEFIEDFKQKLTYGNKIEMAYLKGHIVELAKDQFGSRFLQQRIMACPLEEKIAIYEEIKGQIINLMFDVFGNYVVQILIQKGSVDQLKYIIDNIKGKVMSLSMDMYGCRCIQKGIEYGSPDQRALILDEIKPLVRDYVENQNANHVLQICIMTLQPKFIEFILEYFKANVIYLCKHCYGCRVMQKTIEKSKDLDVNLYKR
jgi:hypothetical protein